MNFAIIVPYRDRQNHLDQFVPAMRAFEPSATIIIVEQEDIGPFNRAKLLNVGFDIFTPLSMAMHDVDKIPLQVDYNYPGERIHQLVQSEIQPKDYLGGVTVFARHTFELLGGYSNNFWGWGGEDNEMFFRAKSMNIPIYEKFGHFRELPHPRPKQEFDMKKWRQAKQPRNPNDGLSGLDFVRNSHRVPTRDEKVIHIKVDLLPPANAGSNILQP